MKKYVITSVLLFANNEIISLMALIALLAMFIYDMLGWMAEGKW